MAAMSLPAEFSEFLGRRLLRIFTSYDRTKIGFEFEQLSTTTRYRYLFDIEGTIDAVEFITDSLGHTISSTTGLEPEYDTGQNKFALYSDDTNETLVSVFYFSQIDTETPVTLTYTVEDRKTSPYGRGTEYIVQEDDFDYGPMIVVPPVTETYYLLAESGDILTTENGDRLLWLI